MLLGGDHTTGADDKAPDTRLLQPPALGQDWALSATIPRHRCLPAVDYDIATDYGLFDELPVTIAMSGPREDITGNTEDDLPLPVRTAAPRGQRYFRSGPSLLHAGPSRH